MFFPDDFTDTVYAREPYSADTGRDTSTPTTTSSTTSA
jgi:hypothetical protein